MSATPNTRIPGAAHFGLLAQRELLWQFTMRNVELRHKGSHLGLVWSFLSPLLMLGLYVFVFGYIFEGNFGRNESRVEYALAIFLGLSIVHLIGETFAAAPSLITSNPNFVKKVVFPLEILPAAGVGASVIHLLISLGLIFIGALLFGPGIGVSALMIPVIVLPIVAMALGLAWFLSAIGVFFRDIGQVSQFLSLALLFSSAVFYPVSSIPEEGWMILRFNPVLLCVELSRDAILWQEPMNLRHLLYLYAFGFLAAFAGHACFQKLRPAFPDVL